MSSQTLPGHARSLTFGVEYEFLVAKSQGDPDPRPQDGRWTAPFGEDWVKEEAQDFIKSLLVRHRIPALSGHRYGSRNIEYVRSEMDRQGFRLSPKRVATHAFWMVTDDSGIELIEEEDVDGYEYVDMEMASRVLDEEDFDEVAAVYFLIQNNIKTLVNSSCGLHIHIGIGHLSLDSIKKLVTLLMVVEHKGLFESVCAPYRTSRMAGNPWCQRVSELSRAVLEQGSLPRDTRNHSIESHLPLPHGISCDLHMALTRIWDCTAVKEIARETLTYNDLIEPGSDPDYSRRGGFALRGDLDFDINRDLVPADPTIEFRYKESTGSAREDYRWLQLCLHLVRCAEWSQDKFRNAMGLLSNANNLEGILNGLGVGGNEAQWWLSIEERHRRHPSPLKKTQFLVPENFSTSGVA